MQQITSGQHFALAVNGEGVQIGVPDSAAKETGLKFWFQTAIDIESRQGWSWAVPLTFVNEPPTMILPSALNCQSVDC